MISLRRAEMSAAVLSRSRPSDPGRQALDWVKINAPIVGPVTRKVTISRSIRTTPERTLSTSG